MAYEMMNNTGALFKNDKKETEKQPDYRGDALVNGEAVWMSAWIKKSAKGATYMSFSFTPKEESRQVIQQAKQEVQSWQHQEDDSIPF